MQACASLYLELRHARAGAGFGNLAAQSAALAYLDMIGARLAAR